MDELLSSSSESWYVSSHNFDPELTKDWKISSKIRLHDNTLRDGEQQAGLVFLKDEKIQAAKLLDELGVPEIELGMPVVSKDDFEAMNELSKVGLKAKLMCLVRSLKSDIDVALEAGVNGVVLEIPSSYILHKILEWNSEEAFSKAIDAVKYAKSKGLYVSLFPWDSTRADFNYWLRLAKAGVQAGADAVTFIDTLGILSPHAMFHMVKKIKQEIKIPLEVHCHNDFGMGTANAISAVIAGAEIVDTAFNGLGERCGNSSTEEVALALKLLYNVDTQLDLSKIYKVSEYIQKISNIKVAPGKPVVGNNTNALEAGIAIDILVKAREKKMSDLAIIPYDNKIIGNKGLKVVLGKKSGRGSIEFKLKELGLSATSGQLDRILSEVKQTAIDSKRSITDDEFKHIVERVL
jgi:isopropylmalate/homocitrate/citramalate synthase